MYQIPNLSREISISSISGDGCKSQKETRGDSAEDDYLGIGQSPVHCRCRHRHRYIPSLCEPTTGDVTAASFILYLSLFLLLLLLFLLSLLSSSPSHLLSLLLSLSSSLSSPHKDHRRSLCQKCRLQNVSHMSPLCHGFRSCVVGFLALLDNTFRRRRSLSRPSSSNTQHKTPITDPVCHSRSLLLHNILICSSLLCCG